MVKIKPLDVIAAKYREVTPGRAPYYEAGVRNPREDWASRTSAAEPAWAQGVQEAVSQKRFSKGVRKAGTPKWQSRALELGVRRWPEGVRVGADEYQKNFAPYHDVLSRLALPERRAKGDPANIQRVAKIAEALHRKKLELLGTSAAGGGT